MHSSWLPFLRCNGCGGPLEAKDQLASADLRCRACDSRVPLRHGFPLFSERGPPTRTTSEHDEHEPDYDEFLIQKERRPAFDLYAAFDPFNEALRALAVLAPLIRGGLRPGDRVLDLSCRTGWSGELLASLLPEQRVLAGWAGRHDVLGVRGFAHWLAEGRRRPNLDIAFFEPHDRLPFADGTFALVHGLDLLHHAEMEPFAAECARVAVPGAVLFFSHVHLSNSRPEPFFERGGAYRHGSWYRHFFDALVGGTGRRSFVVSEKTAFDAETKGEYRLGDQAETGYRNACVYVGPVEHDGRRTAVAPKTDSSHGDAHVFLNPLLSVDPGSGAVRVAAQRMAGGVARLLGRHDFYSDRLQPFTLDLLERGIVYWASRARSVREIAAHLRRDVAAVIRRLEALQHRELVRVENTSRAMARLHRYFGWQRVVADPSEATLSALWTGAVRRHADRALALWPEDGSVFGYGDADMIVRTVAAMLVEHGVRPGDRVAFLAHAHPEPLLLFWAAVLVGAAAVPIGPDTGEGALRRILEQTGAKHFFAHPSAPAMSWSLPCRRWGIAGTEPGSVPDLASAVEGLEPLRDLPERDATDDAVVLYTSGSTGPPKGVVLSHGALFRSSRTLHRVFHWTADHRYLGTGGAHTMSGLRNAWIAPLHAGGSVVVPRSSDLQHPLAVLRLCAEQGVNVLGTVPAFLGTCMHAPERLSASFRTGSVEAVLCTGAPLHAGLRQEFEAAFGVRVQDYYGLTETSGICLAPPDREVTECGVGQPEDSLVAILDPAGQPVAHHGTGRLAILSDNLSRGYESGEPLAQTADGWFLTGDLAHINPDGCVVLAGREDRLILHRSGENVQPEHVERALVASGIVTEAHVTATVDEHGGQRIAAVVTASQPPSSGDPAEELRAAVADALTAAHVPERILVVDQLPRGPGGKVDAARIARMLESPPN